MVSPWGEEKVMQPRRLIITPLAQRQVEEEEESLQAKEFAAQSPGVTPGIESRINTLRGGGQPLPELARAYFEPRFGYDFGQVRVHAESEAGAISRDLNAGAFTVGRDIYFGAGEYNSGTSSGKRLIAHELTHVVQQHGFRNKGLSSYIMQRQLKYIEKAEESEAEKYLAKFDKSLEEIDKQLKDEKSPEGDALREVTADLRILRQKGKVACWYTSGGLYYASYDNKTGELRLHVYFGAATVPDVLIHEGIHALHAAQYPKLSKMYAEALEAGGEKNEKVGILLLKWKAWTEYWAYRRQREYLNLGMPPELQLDAHKSALEKEGVKESVKRVEIETGKKFMPWDWKPPAKYREMEKEEKGKKK